MKSLPKSTTSRLALRIGLFSLLMALIARSFLFATTLMARSVPCEPCAAITNEKQKVWDEMETEEEKEKALKDVMSYLVAFAEKLGELPIDGWRNHGGCDIVPTGSEWGKKQLCNRTYDSCNFISFGISRDYSFDNALAERWNCHGFAADPTVIHPSRLHNSVSFHNIAAKMLPPNLEEASAGKKKTPWWFASIPSVKRFLGLHYIHVLKLDCEGCEYSLARDIIKEDPSFLFSVDQLTFEAHISKKWLNSTESLYYFALLFKLIDEAGLRLRGSRFGNCNVNDEIGRMPILDEINFPPVSGHSCQDYLFSREFQDVKH